MLQKNETKAEEKGTSAVLEESKQARSDVPIDDLLKKSIRTGTLDLFDLICYHFEKILIFSILHRLTDLLLDRRSNSACISNIISLDLNELQQHQHHRYRNKAKLCKL
jgi:hypothetical protein